MSFKVKDLMVSVSPSGFGDEYTTTCTGQTRPTCIASLLFRQAKAEADLAILRAQLRQAVARS